MAMYDKREAPLRGSEEKIFQLVLRGATPAQWAEWLRVPLEHAAASGDLDLVESLLQAGANGKSGWKGCRGRSLLYAATQGGNSEIVAALLKAGAQLDVNKHSGKKAWSPLHHAACGGRRKIARMLMMEGADSGYVSADVCSPLHLAARGGHEQIVCDLLLHGAPPNITDRQEQTPLHVAAKHGHDQVMPALLLKGANVNLLDIAGRSPLHLAARDGRLSATNTLLEAGADVTVLYTGGGFSWSVLALAVENGHVDVIRAVLQHGADVNFRAVADFTPLHWAAFHNHTSAIDVLVEAGADIEARGGSTRRAPLHSAAGSDGCDAVLALLRHGAKVDAPTTDGRTPLTVACQYLADGAARLLLRWGADELSIDGSGRRAEQLIGTRVDELGREATDEDVERVRALLAHAPAERAWRRRGLLVLCRALPHRVRLGSPNDHQTADGMVPKESISRRDCKSARTNETSGGRGREDRGTPGDAADDGSASTEASVASIGVEAKVVGLEQDVIFRTIVCFL